MNSNQTDTGREIITLQGRAVEDAATIATALAKRLVLDLFNLEGRLVLLENGRLIATTNPLLVEIIGRNLVTVQLAYDGSNYVAELCELSLDRQMLTDVANKLLLIVVKAKGQVKQLSDQLRGEIRMRAKSGEPLAEIQRHYGVSREVV